MLPGNGMRVIENGDLECPAFWWGKGKMVIPLVPATWEVRPIEIHIKEDGATDGK